MPFYFHRDGVWTWFNNPVAVYSASKYVIGYVSQYEDAGVGVYDLATATWTPSLVKRAFGGEDDHCNPAVLVLNSSGTNPGKILACYSQHNGTSYSRVTSNALDVSSWAAETTVSSGNSDSYAHLAQTEDTNYTVWWFYRRGASNPRPLQYRVSTDGGASWASDTALITNTSGAAQRPYLQSLKSGARTIELLFTSGQPSEVTNSIYHAQIQIASNGASFNLYNSAGTLIGTYTIGSSTDTSGNGNNLPIDLKTNASLFTKVWDSGSGNSWVWDLAVIGGTLTAAFTVFSTTSTTDDTHRYYQATLSGGTWTTDAICYAGDSSSPGTAGRTPQWIYPDASTSEPEYSPGIALDPNTANRVYVGKKYGDGNARIEQWDKVSGTWGKTTDISGNTSSINARPRVIRDAPSTELLYFQGNPGASNGGYTSYTSYNTNLITYPVLTQNLIARDDFVESSAQTLNTHNPCEGIVWGTNGNRFTTLATPTTPNRIRPVDNIAPYPSYVDCTPNSADYWAQLIVTRVTSVGSATAGPSVRMDSAGTTHYHFRYEDTGNQFVLYRFNSGSATSLATYSTTGITVGSSATLKIQAVGSSPVVITCSVNGTQVISYSDSSGSKITANNYPGLRAAAGSSPSDSTGLQISSFLANLQSPDTMGVVSNTGACAMAVP